MKTEIVLIAALVITSTAIGQQIFDQIYFGGASSTAISMAINAQDHIFIGTYYSEGVYFTTNGGANWSNTKPHANVRDVNSIAITPTGTIIVGMDGTANAGKGVFVSTDNGSTWTKMSTGLPVASVVAVAIGTNGYVYAAAGKQLYRSTDTCKNWVLKNSGLSTSYVVGKIVCAPNGNMYLYQYKSIYRSTDLGESWTKMENGWVEDNMWDIFVNKKGYIYVSTNQNYIYRSTDNGDSFSKITSGLNVYSGKVFCTGENPNGTMFAGSMNPSTVATLYRSTDDGVTWTTMGTAVCYNNLALLTFDSEGFLYASCGGALYKTQQSTLTGVGNYSSEISGNYCLFQNYPNPFNPSTTISFTLPGKTFVSLGVFDLLGHEITTLQSEEMPRGAYTVQWNATNTPSGVYFYRLQAGSFTETKKLVLIR